MSHTLRLGTEWRRRIKFSLLAFSLLYGLLASLPRQAGAVDFGIFLLSGHNAEIGLNPYVAGRPNYNPPISIFAFRALAALDPVVALRGWYAVSLVLYGVSLLLLFRAYRPRLTLWTVLWPLSITGLWTTVELGQIYMPLLLCAVGAWLLVRRRTCSLWAGLLIGLVIAVKPNFVVWAGLLLVGGYWSVALWALATAALLSLVPFVVYGPNIYRQWLSALGTVPARGATDGSIFGVATRLNVPWIAAPLVATLLVTVLILVRRYRPNASQIGALALGSILLVSPVTWPGYTVFLLPAFCHLSFADDDARAPHDKTLFRGTRSLVAASLLLLVPAQFVYRAGLHSAGFALVAGMVYPGATLAFLFAAAMDMRRSNAVSRTAMARSSRTPERSEVRVGKGNSNNAA